MSWFNYLGLVLPQPTGFAAGLSDVEFVDEFQWFDRGIYYRVTNLMNGRKRHEQQRLDRWSNVRRANRARELDRRRKRT